MEGVGRQVSGVRKKDKSGTLHSEDNRKSDFKCHQIIYGNVKPKKDLRPPFFSSFFGRAKNEQIIL
jgi:hypothetical protein